MVDAANLEPRLSIESPPPANQADGPRDADAPQGVEPAAIDTPAPAADRVDISDAARAADAAPTGPANTGPNDFQPAAAENAGATQSSSQSTSSGPAAQIENDPLASNQEASLALEQAGNDTLNQTEAGRTLGQVIDVFA